MLIEHFIKNFTVAFPDISFLVSDDGKVVSIPAICSEVGSIEVQDDDFELTIIVGNFTHWHAGCYEENYSKEQKEKFVSDLVIDFLKDLFEDKIIMRGSHAAGGGFFYLEEASEKSLNWKNGENLWVWSGKYNG